MAFSSGTRLGPYQIISPLGAGGMGEVYRARDTRLDRAVAIKSLPAELSGDSERRSRFEREAKAIAALSHPHICTLYDVGHHEGFDFLVMELLEGETLAARLERGCLKIAEVLVCATQIADALDQAHRQGIIHRDLKPANVMLTRSGAKLLDFGLAKLCSGGAPIVNGLTDTAQLTGQGQIVGTFQYMAPEQLERKEVDARSDLFSFGTIVYEMVTGRRAFKGSSQASLIGAILHGSPSPLTQVAPDVPPALERLLALCLSKNPDDRSSTARDVCLQLKGISENRHSGPALGVQQGRLRERLAWGAAATATLAAIALAMVIIVSRGPRAETGLDLLSVLPAEQTTLAYGEAPQISPDGQHVAFVAGDRSGKSWLYVRKRDSLAARALPGSEEATLPFWAPDSRTLGFFAQGQVKTISISGGSPRTLAPAPLPRGGTWSRDNVILFSPQATESAFS
jgi:serine/threonine protein kinase